MPTEKRSGWRRSSRGTEPLPASSSTLSILLSRVSEGLAEAPVVRYTHQRASWRERLTKLSSSMSEAVSLEKLSLREARELYRAWNEDDLVHRVLTAGQKTPAEKWREYQELMRLCWKLKPEPSLWEQQRSLEEWEAYYEKIRRFEEWRDANEQRAVAAAP